jgi:uroporphyrinogen-III synthase
MRVVLTRPAEDAKPWARELQAAGHEVLLLPRTTIGTAPDSNLAKRCRQRLAEFSAVMFVSANAVAHFFLDQVADLKASGNLVDIFNAAKTRAWATGPGTVQALLDQGIVLQQIDSPAPHAAQFDSEALWQRVSAQIKPGERLLIVRGAANDPQEFSANGNGRDWLASQLKGAGVSVEFCATYQRIRPTFTPAELMKIEQWIGGVDAQAAIWLFSSSESITNLVAALPGRSLGQARAICTHPRIAVHARACGFGVVLQSRPTLADVLASIESLA